MCFPLRSISKRDCIALAKELRRERKPEREDIVVYDTKTRSQCTCIGQYIGVQSEYIYVHLKGIYHEFSVLFIYSGLFILDREHRSCVCVCLCVCARASSVKCGELCGKLQKAEVLAPITLDDLYPSIDLYLLMIHFAHELQNLFLLF